MKMNKTILKTIHTFGASLLLDWFPELLAELQHLQQSVISKIENEQNYIENNSHFWGIIVTRLVPRITCRIATLATIRNFQDCKNSSYTCKCSTKNNQCRRISWKSPFGSIYRNSDYDQESW